MAKKRPVMIWTIRQTPRRDPKFHHDEMLDGAGRSMNEWLIILNNGCVFRMFVVVYKSISAFFFFPFFFFLSLSKLQALAW